jgi:hypothetical protein
LSHVELEGMLNRKYVVPSPRQRPVKPHANQSTGAAQMY